MPFVPHGTVTCFRRKTRVSVPVLRSLTPRRKPYKNKKAAALQPRLFIAFVQFLALRCDSCLHAFASVPLDQVPLGTGLLPCRYFAITTTVSDTAISPAAYTSATIPHRLYHL